MGECQETFNMLKGLYISTPILTFANFTKPFKLHTNANKM